PRLPQIGREIEVLEPQAVSFAKFGLELFRVGKLGGIKQFSGKFSLVVRRHGKVRAIELGQFFVRERQRRSSQDRAGNPAVDRRLLCDFAGSLGRDPGLVADNDLAVLARARLRQLLDDFVKPLEQVATLNFHPARLMFQRAALDAPQSLRDCGDRAFQLPAAVEVTLQHADTKRSQGGNDVLAYHAEGFGGVAGDQNAFSLRQEMADQVADGVGLTRAGRALYQGSAMLFQLLGNSDLLRIRGLAQQNPRLGPAQDCPRRLRRLNAAVVDKNGLRLADDVQQRPRQFLPRAEIVEHALNGCGKAQGARAQEDNRIATDARFGLLVRDDSFDEFPMRRELHDQALQERGSRMITQRMVAVSLQLFAAASHGATVHVTQRLEKRRIQLHGIVRFRECELGYGRIELQL